MGVCCHHGCISGQHTTTLATGNSHRVPLQVTCSLSQGSEKLHIPKPLPTPEAEPPLSKTRNACAALRDWSRRAARASLDGSPFRRSGSAQAVPLLHHGKLPLICDSFFLFSLQTNDLHWAPTYGAPCATGVLFEWGMSRTGERLLAAGCPRGGIRPQRHTVRRRLTVAAGNHFRPLGVQEAAEPVRHPEQEGLAGPVRGTRTFTRPAGGAALKRSAIPLPKPVTPK